MIGPNSSTQCQNKSKHSISFDNNATLLPSFRSGPLVQIAEKIPARTSPKKGVAGIDHTACMCY